MKVKSANFAAIFTIAMLLMSMAPAFAGDPSQPHNADAMWIESSINSFDTNTTSPGHKFNVTVWLNITSADVFSYQVALRYNRNHLKGVDAGFTAAPKSQFMEGHTTTTSGPVIDTSFLGNGSVLAFESCIGDDKITVPQHGSLIWIEFEILAVPGKNETLTSKIDITTETPSNNWVLDSDLNPISITAYDADYEYEWKAPTVNPNMAIEHDGFYGTLPSSPGPPDVWPLWYGPYEPSAVGAAFDVNIYIEDLVAAWNLWNATFDLTYNNTVIDVVDGSSNVTIDPAWGSNITTVTPGKVEIYVEDYSPAPPAGKVLVATIKFTVMMQESVPPYPSGHYDYSTLTFENVVLYDHVIEIPTDPSEEGEVRILGVVAIPMPWLEVTGSGPLFEFGPEPSIGKEFDVGVKVLNLDEHWYIVFIQFRLAFCPDLLELVSVTEGPFLQDARWNLHGTFFMSFEEANGMFGPHIVVGNMLSTNTTTGEYDQTQYPTAAGPNVTALDPPADPLLATIRFKIIKQDYSCEPANHTCGLDILPFWKPEDCHFINNKGDYVPTDTDEIVNGTYIIDRMFRVGRMIDLTGGAVNRGYGGTYGTPFAFPAPFGGQGPNQPMDLVIPQSVVYLLTEVTYNFWPVQYKDVGYEIEGPYYQEEWNPEQPVPKPRYYIVKYSSVTDHKGFAWIKFQMPWQCENATEYFGKYKVTATVDICGEVVMDVMWFDYFYLIANCKVTVDKDPANYCHCEHVEVTVEFESKAQQYYPVLFAIVIQDELETHVAFAIIETTVGGARFCTWKEYSVTVSLHIPKWAFAGLATIYVSAFDMDPTVGGAPWGPGCTTEICILPCPLDP